MTDAVQKSFIRQRNVEHLLAAAATQYPLYTMEQCRWLKEDTLRDDKVRQYWRLLKERLDGQTDDDEAQTVAIQTALETDIYKEILDWQKDLSYTPMPQAYANEISRRAYITRITEQAPRLTQAIMQFDDKLARRIIGEMHAERPPTGATLPTAQDVAAQFDRVVSEGKRSIDTFIPPMDSALGGLERQTLSLLAARPSMGKTALAWQIAQNVATSGQRVIFASLEMSSVSLWARAACPKVGVTWRDVRSGAVKPDDIEKLKKESSKLAERFNEHLRIVDTPQTTETLWQMIAEYRPDIVIADHLRKFKDEDASEVKRLGNICAMLKEMSKTFNCAVTVCVQLNRSLESRSDKRPMLSDLRDSGEIEEEADVVLMMYRDDYYSNENNNGNRSATEVWVRKFRDGPANVLINLDFDKRREWFEARIY